MTDGDRKTAVSVLAIHPGALGDVILMGHLLRRVSGRVTLVAGGRKATLLASLGVAAVGLDYDSLPMHEAFTDIPPADSRLARALGRHDRLIGCFAAGDERAERRLTEMCAAAEADFLPVRPPPDHAGHLLELWLSRLPEGRDGGPWSPDAAAWPVPHAWLRRAADVLAGMGIEPGRPYVAIHPGASSQAKCWPLERFVELASRMAQRRQAVVFIVGPVERDLWHGHRPERLGSEWPLLSSPKLSTLAGVLAAASLYVGNDSGVSQLAGTVGTATLALFGPSNPTHFRPVGPRVQTIRAGAMEDMPLGQVLERLDGFVRL